jgi:hypothetical protein
MNLCATGTFVGPAREGYGLPGKSHDSSSRIGLAVQLLALARTKKLQNNSHWN